MRPVWEAGVLDFWQGKRIRLRALEPADAEIFFTWNRDSEMPRNVDFVWPPGSLAMQRRWAEEGSLKKMEGDNLFLVMENRDGEVVGSINTHDCDRRTGCFSYGVAVRREHQCRGYASEAIQLVLRYFFEELRYQKVTVHVTSYNAASIRLHQRLGFQLEGRLRRMQFTEAGISTSCSLA